MVNELCLIFIFDLFAAKDGDGTVRERRQVRIVGSGAVDAHQGRLCGEAADGWEKLLCAIVDDGDCDGPGSGGLVVAQVGPAHASAAGEILKSLRRLAAR